MSVTKMNKETYEIIKKQLGREPDNVIGVARHCPHNQPLVIISQPFSQEKGIFPTIYWLSCPYYVRAVDRIEDKGLIEQLTLKLHNDPFFRRQLETAHNNYVKKRMSLLNKSDLKKIEELSLDIIKVLKESGVGGIRNKGGIKCLHTHLAHYLVDQENPAGKIVFQKLPSLSNCQGCNNVDN